MILSFDGKGRRGGPIMSDKMAPATLELVRSRSQTKKILCWAIQISDIACIASEVSQFRLLLRNTSCRLLAWCMVKVIVGIFN